MGTRVFGVTSYNGGTGQVGDRFAWYSNSGENSISNSSVDNGLIVYTNSLNDCYNRYYSCLHNGKEETMYLGGGFFPVNLPTSNIKDTVLRIICDFNFYQTNTRYLLSILPKSFATTYIEGFDSSLKYSDQSALLSTWGFIITNGGPCIEISSDKYKADQGYTLLLPLVYNENYNLVSGSSNVSTYNETSDSSVEDLVLFVMGMYIDPSTAAGMCIHSVDVVNT
jgi:hypothetical protein